ncbi:uncharacterized protein LOC111703390 [Eurytemora carolleeae]|uniref:uncharacterized protein LOC111703390 n=1 Tax=Eurytemora carolleeae TaxID=1294199 RepID=UPI000C76B5C6|nr:uncharacterized protein LOC111703390 [Eurytemora carolleeae]|eukprot:XP_023331086.1 uncharacterized protein LOC111703390 [Eurytemora affinis]
MDRLELELGGEILFDMNLFDYETGLNHKIKDAVSVLEEESLRFEHNNLQFQSTSTIRGNRADTVICTNIGPSLVEQGFIVFRGGLKMIYEDQPCYPVPLQSSQWCL